MARWEPSQELAEHMAECRWVGPVTASTAAECIGEWMQRYEVDLVASDAGILKDNHPPAETYAHTALLQCRDQGLDLADYDGVD